MVVQYSELQLTRGWDLLASLRHPCKFQCVSRLGSVTARQSSSGQQPNFAALNIGRHLYSAGRPSRWAFAHILVLFFFPQNFHHHLASNAMYRVAQKLAPFVYALIDFQNYFTVRIRRKCVIMLPLKIWPHLKCVATLPCDMSSVLKATIENKTTSVTTHVKKLIVSVIV